jgi:hypothetical protein
MNTNPAAPATAADAQSDLLHRALAASGDSCCWLLVDPTVRPLDDDEPLLRALSEAGAEIVPVRSPNSRIDNSVLPILARLDSARSAGSAALRLSISEALAECEPEALRRGAARRIGGWLQCSASGAALAHHIGQQMVCRRQDGRLTLLRWTDPAVLWVIWSSALLTQQQQAELLGPISAYHLLDAGGRCTTLDQIGASRSSAVDEASEASRYAFTARQWAQLDAIGSLNRALLRFDAARLDAASLNEARDNGMAAILRARSLGFADAQDLATFAWHAMSVHPRFDAHPVVAERLQKRQADDLFTALVDPLDVRTWSCIANDPWEARPY